MTNEQINKKILAIVSATAKLYPHLTFAQLLTNLGVDPQNQSHFMNETILRSIKSMYHYLKTQKNDN